jgi:hypothetical protein
MAPTIESELRRLQRQAEGFHAGLAYVRPMQQYETGSGMLLTVNSVGYGHAELDRVLDGTADAIEAVLTEDGRTAVTWEWHQGHSWEQVFVERWDETGRAFHGWVDKASRKLVQAG